MAEPTEMTEQTPAILANFKKEISLWHIFGGIGIFGLAALLHFVFEWTGSWAPIGWFVAVNESPWEHLKLPFYPSIILFIIEFFFLYKKTNNYFLAKAAGTYATPFIIITLFYAYTGAFGFENVKTPTDRVKSYCADSLSIFFYNVGDQYSPETFHTQAGTFTDQTGYHIDPTQSKRCPDIALDMF